MKGSKLVTTVCGNTVKRTEAKQIAGKFYLPGVSCFEFIVDGKPKFYKVDSPYIAYDWSTGAYAIRKELQYFGVVNIDSANLPVFGFFSKYDGGPEILTSEDGVIFRSYCGLSYDLFKNKWPENISTGVFYDPRSPESQSPSLRDKKRVEYKSIRLEYNANSNNNLFEKTISEYAQTNIPISESVKKIAPFFKKYTLGIEFETLKGTIPYYLLKRLGLVPLRDGSISGYEYTTIPLSGAKGIQTIVNDCEELAKRCIYNHTCSMHVHVGNVRTDMLFLIAFYKLCSIVQHQMFELVPHYKKDPVNIASLRKNYCQMLKDIGMRGLEKIPSLTNDKKAYDALVRKNYQCLYNFLSGGVEAEISNNPARHPQGNNKWDRHNRYYWVNFIPVVYDNRTLEFRLHAGTFNANKVLFWILLNLALLEYADKNSEKVLACTGNIMLVDIISNFCQQFEDGLWLKFKMIEYVNERRAMFANCFTMGDYLGKSDVKLDSGSLSVQLVDTNESKFDRILANSFMLNRKVYEMKKSPDWITSLAGVKRTGITNSIVEEIKV